MGKIMMRQLAVGVMQTNCYLIYDDETKETVIIDPGARAKQIEAVIEQNELKPVVILLTHGHFDHVGAAEELRERYSISILCHEEEKEILENPSLNLSSKFKNSISLKANQTFQDKEILHYLGREITVLHTPGHTKGSCCFYFEHSPLQTNGVFAGESKEQFLISGDTLFAESVGRTDFPTGNTTKLVKSIEETLFCLPDEIPVYPGHNESTTIGHEKKYNPCVRG